MMRKFHLVGISVALALFIVVIFSVYFPASFAGKKMVCIETNLYGEHWLEFVWIVVGLVIFLHFVWINMKES